jgi:hypothetical protein
MTDIGRTMASSTTIHLIFSLSREQHPVGKTLSHLSDCGSRHLMRHERCMTP